MIVNLGIKIFNLRLLPLKQVYENEVELNSVKGVSEVLLTTHKSNTVILIYTCIQII